ncbi:MAG: undecaprenyldiphospho-muramoylpentapeptide beta-N-acetylglucosaminyltransferase [Bacteroidales bacterium]|nr:undecaprenyldiphospho-muramoylpentapeptide beta-N-acetylglucosaminyltransferase [Bacteroidales bacterium]MDD3960927.1 undecaprenyldiphospho-muramoylpentapeptide beta-N-acetylglucosaminyltransferase [Bacteroidales bacterium]HPE85700.1 undecaprenyldiphospho-muramoylpentapeptide beta-N-acetylglucosaminyltransferase [Bacteroidales bacterium]
MNPKTHKYLISGGGTGGHIFPAIAIAEAIKARDERAQFLFVGASGKMEMKKVPDAGYPIIGLPISGFKRTLSAKNLLFPFKLMCSLQKAAKIIRTYNPDVVIGTGGYASGPTLYMASRKKIPCLIQEQNAFPGITNKTLAKHVDKICVAYSGMETYFPKEKIILTGNPIRKELQSSRKNTLEARRFFGIENENKTILVVGGSQGSRAINQQLINILPALLQKVNVIWQTGETGIGQANEIVQQTHDMKLSIQKFIKRMDLAYTAADIVISRAGAIAISELAVAGKCTLLIPMPQSAEDHQTKNANRLAGSNAAICLPQNELAEKMLPVLMELLNNEKKIQSMEENIKKFGLPEAAGAIAEEILKLIEKQ